MRSIYEFGVFRLDSAERLLLKAGQPISLTPKAFDLLLYLAERPGRLVTKQELMTALWPDTFVEETNLAYSVSMVRKALGDGQDGGQFIQTVPTRGYRFLAAVRHDDKPLVSSDERPAGGGRLLRRVASVTAIATAIAIAPAVIRQLRETTAAPVPARFSIPVPDSAAGAGSLPMAQISPDGRRVAFTVRSDGRVWLRSIEAGQANPIAGTRDAKSVFWAPDSQQLVFTTESALKKVTISDGTIETLCDRCLPGLGGTWSRNGLILFPSQNGGLLGIRASGGLLETVTRLDQSRGDVAHIAPHFLPDGERFLYVIRNADADRSGLYVGRLGSTELRLLLGGEHPAIYAAPGYLLFASAANIVAQPFDVTRLELGGDVTSLVGRPDFAPTPLQGGDVLMLNWFGVLPSFAASNTGILTYGIAEAPETQFQWLTRAGAALQTVGEPGPFMTFDLSSDGTSLVFSKRAEEASLWLLDVSRGVATQMTFGPASYSSPRWGPDKQWIAAHRPEPPPLAVVKLLPDGRESVIAVPGAEACRVDDISNDGRYLLCRPIGSNLVAVPLSDGGKPILIRKAPTGAIDPSQFSPDGRSIAYDADETGRYEVYVTGFPPTGERWQISRDGGVQPMWRQDGRELYYLTLDGVLNVVEVRPGDPPQFSVAKRLFDTGLVAPSPWVEQYTVTADGQRVLILKPVRQTVRNSIGVILNWPSLLRR